MIDLLSEFLSLLEEIGFTCFPHFTVLRDWLNGSCCGPTVRFLLNQPRNILATLHRPDWLRPRSPFRYYANRKHYRVRSLKVAALVDVKSLYIYDVHFTATKKHDAKIGPQVTRPNTAALRSLAADKACESKPFRDDLGLIGFVHPFPTESTRRSIKHTARG